LPDFSPDCPILRTATMKLLKYRLHRSSGQALLEYR